MNREVVGHLVRVVIKECVKDTASQFQKFRVNFYKFHALFSIRLSHLGYAIITSFAQNGFQKIQKFSHNAENVVGFASLERYRKDADNF
jgi:hypothetical protein